LYLALDWQALCRDHLGNHIAEQRALGVDFRRHDNRPGGLREGRVRQGRDRE
jgi:hypothetical protein